MKLLRTHTHPHTQSLVASYAGGRTMREVGSRYLIPPRHSCTALEQ